MGRILLCVLLFGALWAKDDSAKKACDDGKVAKCVEYARAMNAEGDRKKAFEYYMRACDGGDSDGCDGVKAMNSDDERLCADGVAKACDRLGDYYKKRDARRAREFFERGCELGHTYSCESAKYFK